MTNQSEDGTNTNQEQNESKKSPISSNNTPNCSQSTATTTPTPVAPSTPGRYERAQDEATATALANANALNSSLLESDRERSYITLSQNYGDQTKTCSEQQSQISSLQDAVTKLQGELSGSNGELASALNSLQSERKMRNDLESDEKGHVERMGRMEVEADSLFQQVSRLTNNNVSLNTQLTELKTSTTLNSTSTPTLQYEIVRLNSELESLNAHSIWLESELSTRSTQNSDLRILNASTERDLTKRCDALTLERDDALLDSTNLTNRCQGTLNKLNAAQLQVREGETRRADTVQEMQMEMQAERRLVQLNRENASRMEDRYNDAIREIESMKRLAAVAVQEHVVDVDRIRNEIEANATQAIHECKKQFEIDLNKVNDRLRITMMEKTKLEDDFMSGARGKNTTKHTRAIASVAAEDRDVLQLQYTSQDGQRMTLTDVYEKLAEAEEEARHERAERRRTELLLERIQREIEITVPKRRQERREYEHSIKQMADMQERLHDALQEKEAVKDNLNQKQMEGRATTHECRELRLENGDLARQVQSLLRSSLGGADDTATDVTGDIVIVGSAEEMQNQNQRLLREHHKLTSHISDLEKKLNTDTVHIRLRDAEGSMKDMLEERQNQAVLVASIVQQRDLYRALLAKNDSQLLASTATESTDLVVVNDQDEKYSQIEGENAELKEAIAKLKAELSTTINLKQGLEERLARLDTHCEDLTDTIKTQQREFSSAQASTARSQAELSYTKQVVDRLEESLTIAKKEVTRLGDSKRELQRLNEDLQSALSTSRAGSTKHDEDLRQSTVQLSLAQTKLISLQAAESRLAAENNTLRSEMSRHTALHESMQKIETSISSRADEERERLCEEGRRLNTLLLSERDKHNEEVENMRNRLADVDNRANVLEKKGDDANSNALMAKNEAVAAQSKVLSLNEKCEALQEALNVATIKLGTNEDTDTSDQDRLVSMTTDLEVIRAELVAAKKQVEDYRNISKVNEDALADSMKTTEDLKVKLTAEVDILEAERNRAQLTAHLKQEALEELSKDLNKREGEQEKVIRGLKEKSETLTTEVKIGKDDNKSLVNQVDSLTKEMNMYKTDAKAANNNYERELELHAAARAALRNSRSDTEKESQRKESLASQLNEVKVQILGEKDAWAETKTDLESTSKSASTKLEELQQQNKVLHSQLAALAETVEKYQSEKLASLSEFTDSLAEKTEDQAGAENISLQKQISELREIVCFMRSERETLDSQLLSARRSTERERAAAEVLKRSLEEARAELTILQKSGSDGVDGRVDSSDKLKKTHTDLKQKEEQLILMRESNQLLREETEKLSKSVSTLETDLNDTKVVFEPTVQKCHELEVDKAALEAEKSSLAREVEAWKDRVKSLVSKFHQIDPEDHLKALAKVEESKKECVVLQAAKEQADKETSSAKALIIRLNKDITKQREITDATKTALEKMTAKKADAAAALKDLDSVKKMKASGEKELQGSKERVERLVIMLRGNKEKHIETKQKLNESVQREKETKAILMKEEKVKKALLKEVERIKLQEENKRATRSTSTEIIIRTQPPPTQDVMKSLTPAPSVCEQPSIEAPMKSSPQNGNLDSDNKTLVVPSEGFMFAPSLITCSEPTSLPVDFFFASSKVVTQNDESTISIVNIPKSDGITANNSVEIAEKKDSLPQSSKLTQTIIMTGGIIPPKEFTGHNVEHVGKSVGIPLEKANIIPKALVSKEDALREKIMKKKRQYAQLKGKSTPPILDKRPAKRERADSAATTAAITTDGSTRPSQDESMFSQSITNGTKVQVSTAPVNASIGPTTELKQSLASSTISNIPSTSSTFGSGFPASLSQQGVTFGSNVTSFGANITSLQTTGDSKISLALEPAIASGAFLNLKPPGSGQSKLLVFGKSSNIILPTPSKTSTPSLDSMKQQPFGAFGVQPQDGNTSFNSSALGAFPCSVNPKISFDGVVSKKRTHQDDVEEVSSTKLARVENSDEKILAVQAEALVKVKKELDESTKNS